MNYIQIKTITFADHRLRVLAALVCLSQAPQRSPLIDTHNCIIPCADARGSVVNLNFGISLFAFNLFWRCVYYYLSLINCPPFIIERAFYSHHQLDYQISICFCYTHRSSGKVCIFNHSIICKLSIYVYCKYCKTWFLMFGLVGCKWVSWWRLETGKMILHASLLLLRARAWRKFTGLWHSWDLDEQGRYV